MEIFVPIASRVFGRIMYIPNRIRVQRYIENVLKYVKVIIENDSPSRDTVAYAHHMVKTLHSAVCGDIGNFAKINEIAIIKQALSAARIYYWIRYHMDSDRENIMQLIEGRQRRIRHGEVRLNSNEGALQEIEGIFSKSATPPEFYIRLLKDNFLPDITELERIYIKETISARFRIRT